MPVLSGSVDRIRRDGFEKDGSDNDPSLKTKGNSSTGSVPHNSNSPKKFVANKTPLGRQDGAYYQNYLRDRDRKFHKLKEAWFVVVEKLESETVKNLYLEDRISFLESQLGHFLELQNKGIMGSGRAGEEIKDKLHHFHTEMKQIETRRLFLLHQEINEGRRTFQDWVDRHSTVRESTYNRSGEKYSQYGPGTEERSSVVFHSERRADSSERKRHSSDKKQNSTKTPTPMERLSSPFEGGVCIDGLPNSDNAEAFGKNSNLPRWSPEVPANTTTLVNTTPGSSMREKRNSVVRFPHIPEEEDISPDTPPLPDGSRQVVIPDGSLQVVTPDSTLNSDAELSLFDDQFKISINDVPMKLVPFTSACSNEASDDHDGQQNDEQNVANTVDDMNHVEDIHMATVDNKDIVDSTNFASPLDPTQVSELRKVDLDRYCEERKNEKAKLALVKQATVKKKQSEEDARRSILPRRRSLHVEVNKKIRINSKEEDSARNDGAREDGTTHSSYRPTSESPIKISMSPDKSRSPLKMGSPLKTQSPLKTSSPLKTQSPLKTTNSTSLKGTTINCESPVKRRMQKLENTSETSGVLNEQNYRLTPSSTPIKTTGTMTRNTPSVDMHFTPSPRKPITRFRSSTSSDRRNSADCRGSAERANERSSIDGKLSGTRLAESMTRIRMNSEKKLDGNTPQRASPQKITGSRQVGGSQQVIQQENSSDVKPSTEQQPSTFETRSDSNSRPLWFTGRSSSDDASDRTVIRWNASEESADSDETVFIQTSAPMSSSSSSSSFYGNDSGNPGQVSSDTTPGSNHPGTFSSLHGGPSNRGTSHGGSSSHSCTTSKEDTSKEGSKESTTSSGKKVVVPALNFQSVQPQFSSPARGKDDIDSNATQRENSAGMKSNFQMESAVTSKPVGVKNVGVHSQANFASNTASKPSKPVRRGSEPNVTEGNLVNISTNTNEKRPPPSRKPVAKESSRGRDDNFKSYLVKRGSTDQFEVSDRSAISRSDRKPNKPGMISSDRSYMSCSDRNSKGSLSERNSKPSSGPLSGGGALSEIKNSRPPPSTLAKISEGSNNSRSIASSPPKSTGSPNKVNRKDKRRKKDDGLGDEGILTAMRSLRSPDDEEDTDIQQRRNLHGRDHHARSLDPMGRNSMPAMAEHEDRHGSSEPRRSESVADNLRGYLLRPNRNGSHTARGKIERITDKPLKDGPLSSMITSRSNQPVANAHNVHTSTVPPAVVQAPQMVQSPRAQPPSPIGGVQGATNVTCNTSTPSDNSGVGIPYGSNNGSNENLKDQTYTDYPAATPPMPPRMLLQNHGRSSVPLPPPPRAHAQDVHANLNHARSGSATFMQPQVHQSMQVNQSMPGYGNQMAPNHDQIHPPQAPGMVQGHAQSYQPSRTPFGANSVGVSGHAHHVQQGHHLQHGNIQPRMQPNMNQPRMQKPSPSESNPEEKNGCAQQ